MSFLLMLFVFGIHAHAADPANCAKYTSIAIPKTDLPKPGDEKNLHDCSPTQEYYGLANGANHFERARKCAFLERDKTFAKQSLAPGVLMMVYANGHDTSRSIDLANRFVCESNLTPTEKGKWIDYLESKRLAKTEDDIDFCERFFEDSYKQPCTDLRKIRQASVREKKFKEFAAKFTAKQKPKFEHLLEVTRRFFKLDAAWKNPGHAEGEERNALIEAHEAYAWEQFEIEIEHLEEQKRLHPPAEPLNELDERLNKKYREYKRDLKQVDKTPLVLAQRMWIDYRDAYVDFAVSRYEPKDTNAWHAELTLKRIEELTF